MVQIQFQKRIIHVKILYHGPPTSGRTTSLEAVWKQWKGEKYDKEQIRTEDVRTMTYPMRWMGEGEFNGMSVRLVPEVAPGSAYYHLKSKLAFQGVDGILFVADSRPESLAENIEYHDLISTHLESLGLKPEGIPTVYQFNKRDHPDALPVEKLRAELHCRGPVFETVATEGREVLPAYLELVRRVMEVLNSHI